MPEGVPGGSGVVWGAPGSAWGCFGVSLGDPWGVWKSLKNHWFSWYFHHWGVLERPRGFLVGPRDVLGGAWGLLGGALRVLGRPQGVLGNLWGST